MQDRELLCQFVQTRSQEAFSQLVHRHMDPVYSSARRQVRNSQLAEDVAQAVFIILARKAAKLLDRDSLAGWLMKTTHLASLDAIKVESRRKRHEQRAAGLVESRMEQNMTPSAEISSELDRALSRLNEADRSAVTLRYLQGKSAGETARSLGISEPAAAKRITRAVDRLRKILLARRVIAPAVALAVLLDQIPRLAAPVALADSTVIAGATGVASPAGLTIAKGVLHMLTFHKIAAAILLIAALAGATGIGVGTARLLADQNPAGPSVPPAAPIATPDLPPISSASLSNGVSIEILGISENPSTGKQWWLANGEPLGTPPYARMGGQVVGTPDSIAREFAVTVNDSIAGSTDHATVRWFVTHSRGSSSSNPQDDRGKLIDDIDAQAVLVPDAPAGVTIKAEVAAGNWTTVCAVSNGGSSSQAGPSGSFLFSNTFIVDRRTHIVVAYAGRISTSGLDVRLVAVDRDGKVVPANGAGAASTDSGYVGEYSIALPKNSIRQWELQTRPFDQWMEIRGISLHPGQNTNVTTATSDDQKNP